MEQTFLADTPHINAGDSRPWLLPPRPAPASGTPCCSWHPMAPILRHSAVRSGDEHTATAQNRDTGMARGSQKFFGVEIDKVLGTGLAQCQRAGDARKMHWCCWAW